MITNLAKIGCHDVCFISHLSILSHSKQSVSFILSGAYWLVLQEVSFEIVWSTYRHRRKTTSGYTMVWVKHCAEDSGFSCNEWNKRARSCAISSRKANFTLAFWKD